MPQLYLLRHAKSSWSTPLTGDHERPLAPRGEATAPLIAEEMKARGFVPDHILCSTAKRARQTLDLVLNKMAIKPPTCIEAKIYDAAPQDLIDLISQNAPNCQNLLLVGHNPAIHYAAAQMSLRGDDQALMKLEQKYPTAGLAVIDFDESKWHDGDVSNGYLTAFITPRTLVAGGPDAGDAAVDEVDTAGATPLGAE